MKRPCANRGHVEEGHMDANEVVLYIEPIAGGRDWKTTKPSSPLQGGDSVSWEFRLNGYEPPPDLEARFQFTDANFAREGLTPHWTSNRPLRVGEPFRIVMERPKQRDRDARPFTRELHYAVMVSGTDLDRMSPGKVQFVWAHGQNPPPKVDVGG